MRKRLSFGLQPVLAHRKRLEDAAFEAYAVRCHTFEAAALEIASRQEELRGCELAMTGAATGARVVDLQRCEVRLLFLRRCIETLGRALLQARFELDAARRAALDARTQRKLIDALRNRKIAALVTAQMRAEQTELDDANTLRRACHPERSAACHPERRRGAP